MSHDSFWLLALGEFDCLEAMLRSVGRVLRLALGELYVFMIEFNASRLKGKINFEEAFSFSSLSVSFGCRFIDT